MPIEPIHDYATYPAGKYLIRRYGLWFRSGAHGYTVKLHDCGLFERENAIKYLHVEGLTIHHVSEIQDKIQEEIADARARIVALEAQAQAIGLAA